MRIIIEMSKSDKVPLFSQACLSKYLALDKGAISSRKPLRLRVQHTLLWRNKKMWTIDFSLKKNAFCIFTKEKMKLLEGFF